MSNLCCSAHIKTSSTPCGSSSVQLTDEEKEDLIKGIWVEQDSAKNVELDVKFGWCVWGGGSLSTQSEDLHLQTSTFPPLLPGVCTSATSINNNTNINSFVGTESCIVGNSSNALPCRHQLLSLTVQTER